MLITFEDGRFQAVSRYDERFIVKNAGFRWDKQAKRWETDDAKKVLPLAEYCNDAAQAALADLVREQAGAIEASRAVDADVEVPCPDGLEYMPFQRAGIAYALRRAHTLFADQMGLGKTVEAIGVLNADTSVRSVLVICPAHLRLNWMREIQKWSVRPCKILVSSSKPPTDDLEDLFRLVPLHNQIGQNGLQKQTHIGGAGYPPSPLGLSRPDAAIGLQGPLPCQPPEGSQPIDKATVSVRNGNLPAASTDTDPSLAVDNPGDVPEDSGITRDAQGWLAAPETTECLTDQPPVVIADSGIANAKGAGDLGDSEILRSHTSEPGQENIIADASGPGHIEVLIINYDILHNWQSIIRSRTWSIVISDECHALKNPKARRTQQVFGRWDRDPEKRIAHIGADRCLWLTGTPILNRPVELWPLLKRTGWRGSWKDYVERFCAAYRDRWGWKVDGASNLDELQSLLRQTIMVRRLKADVLTELPAKRRQVIEIPANGAAGTVAAEAHAWALRQDEVAMLQAAVELAKASDDEEEYREAVRALQVGMMAAFTEMSALRHETALAKVPWVIEHLADAVEGGPVVCFCHHRDVVKAVAAGLKERDIESLLATGDMATDDRQTNVDRFQAGDAPVFLGTIGAAGTGITLTAASHVVFAELDWVPGNITQAEDRCHRIGQTNAVLIQHLVLEASLDAILANRLVEKQAVIDAALDDPIEGAVEPEWGSLITPLEPATRSAQRSHIAAEATALTPTDVVLIHEQLRFLAARCDGAIALDGAGFNGIDSPIGKSLATLAMLTPKQAALGQRILGKYRGQLEAMPAVD